MVGVPGRSSGCHTCRSRHIKCDERKPTCHRCEKSGYACQGYNKPIHFRIHTAGASASTDTRSKEPQDQRYLMVKKTRWTNQPAAVPRELDLSAFQNDMAFSFTFKNLTYSSFGRPWLQMAAADRIDATSSAACKALALGFLGNSQRQLTLQNKSAVEYGASLRLLIKELANVKDENAGMYIIPVMILLMYNFSVCKNADFSHHEGLRQLVLFCGPERFQQQPLLSAFEATRDILISKALLEQKRTFFEEPHWKTIPWLLNPTAKNPTNQLLDILADIPGFLEDEATVKQTGDHMLQLSLFSRVEQHLQELYKWRWAWEANNPGAAIEITSSPSSSPEDPSTPQGLETVLRYSTFLQANEICLYNAVLLWLLRFLDDLSPGGSASASSLNTFESPATFSSPSNTTRSNQSTDAIDDEFLLAQDNWSRTPATPLLLPGQARSLGQPALEICRSFEFLLHSFARSNDTALSWMMPISLAYYVVQEDNAYTSWIRRKLNAFEGKENLPMFQVAMMMMKWRADIRDAGTLE
ncbi:uncharacterized protein K452DRAFT_303367 [Aplosporella prunicola CBS 121167]|uniref:Zn(2)-C6 fungal-type domain-containing protein n=1 Tax=Aplosporella prunicola CBS 121167 TaxID=1176127 RepID=A0A6A6AUI9_9PEZI|nr:uncharacterized protein K452DRAFT_303367 [Aplosporella prunicola CBS 121167]KAF2135682.1 hypothetical protein K452DRAFT_303367 [Aplosporella prunicola CBS 121167]